LSAQCVESNLVVRLGVRKKEWQKTLGVANKSGENGRLKQPGSTQVPVNLALETSSDTSDAFVGQWDELMLGVRTNLEIQFLRERYADNGQVVSSRGSEAMSSSPIRPRSNVVRGLRP
jgi:hypothetical protein